MSAPKDGAGTVSGWCMSGYCLPGRYTTGCPGTFATIGDCACTCHRGDVPERSVRTRAAQEQWAADGTLAAFQDPVTEPAGAGPDAAA